MKTTMKKSTAALALVAAFGPLAFVGADALAYDAGSTTSLDNGDPEIDAFLQVVVGWLQGPLGTLLAITCFGIGLAMGAYSQSLMSVVVGIFFAAAVNYGPSILQGISGSATAAM